MHEPFKPNLLVSDASWQLVDIEAFKRLFVKNRREKENIGYVFFASFSSLVFVPVRLVLPWIVDEKQATGM